MPVRVVAAAAAALAVLVVVRLSLLPCGAFPPQLLPLARAVGGDHPCVAGLLADQTRLLRERRRAVGTRSAGDYAALGRLKPAASLGDGAVLAEARASAEAVGAYLAGMVAPGGAFHYEYDIATSRSVSGRPRYNVLRHAGSVYALVMHAERGGGGFGTVERALAFFRLAFVRPAEGGRVAVWSLPHLNGDRRGLGVVKLGGCGIGLLAMASAERARPGTVPLEEMRGLADFILFMQRADGSFASKYAPAAGGMMTDWVSLYYPGEASLGLMALYEVDPDPRWLDAAVRTLLYLARLRRGQRKVEPDHWALIATGRLLQMAATRPEVEARLARGDDRALVVAHAVQVARFIMGEQAAARPHLPARLRGAFDARGRATPTSTRLEGLLAVRAAAAAVRDGEFPPGFVGELDRCVAAAMRFLVRAWIRDGADRGAVPQMPVGAADARNDYNQHALAAFLQYIDVYG